jgi:hypothetical protein
MRRNKDSGLRFQKPSPLAPNMLSFLVVFPFLALISNTIVNIPYDKLTVYLHLHHPIVFLPSISEQNCT